ncbi:hypothetical protein GCM10023152_15720 [Agromyces bauzanensis]|uniref:Uncharacterized protein n=1 Tax=Agromyces bauzanensis TaxID=1308924 RepID=A0A917PRL7_9MICO|nr:hypothetical protein GCM10011372_28770 [Agromyces bauzanensis]
MIKPEIANGFGELRRHGGRPDRDGGDASRPPSSSRVRRPRDHRQPVVTGAGTLKVWRGDTTNELSAKVLGSSECLDLAAT